MSRSLLAVILLVAGCAIAAPAATPSPSAPSPSAPPTAAPTATVAPTVAPTSTTGPSAGYSCDPDMAYGCDYPSPSASAAATGDVQLSLSAAGYVVGPNGHSLYVFDNDSAGTSACNGGCADNWPLLLVTGSGTPVAAGVCCPGELGTITRDDGSRQVTLAGRLLYYYAADTDAGDTYGDGSGGVWHLAH